MYLLFAACVVCLMRLTVMIGYDWVSLGVFTNNFFFVALTCSDFTCSNLCEGLLSTFLFKRNQSGLLVELGCFCTVQCQRHIGSNEY